MYDGDEAYDGVGKFVNGNAAIQLFANLDYFGEIAFALILNAKEPLLLSRLKTLEDIKPQPFQRW